MASFSKTSNSTYHIEVSKIFGSEQSMYHALQCLELWLIYRYAQANRGTFITEVELEAFNGKITWQYHKQFLMTHKMIEEVFNLDGTKINFWVRQ